MELQTMSYFKKKHKANCPCRLPVYDTIQESITYKSIEIQKRVHKYVMKKKLAAKTMDDQVYIR